VFLNPFTGEVEGYNSPSTGAGVGMEAASAIGIQDPLVFRMLEKSPGIATSMAFTSFRGTNTLLRGGSRPDLFSLDASSKDYFSGKIKPGKSPFIRPSLRNNMPRFRNFGQYTDLSIFADPNAKRYTPFGTANFLGRSRVGTWLANTMGVELENGQASFGSGLTSGISAGRRADNIERQALRGSTRAQAKLLKMDDAIDTLTKMNNPEALVNTMKNALSYKDALNMSPMERGGLGANDYMKSYNNSRFVPGSQVRANSMRVNAMHGGGTVGIRGNQYASSLPGGVTKHIAGYFRGAQGFAEVGGLTGQAKEGADRAVKHIADAFDNMGGFEGKSGKVFLKGDAADFLSKRAFREMGVKGAGAIVKAGGAKAAMALGARAAAFAIPGMQVVGAAMLINDLGNMTGELIKGGINLARDAGKSLQGSIAKPTFGMGYKDTEAAATSRARGVMAIQNSRLNMRSLLGSEASMLAAHYG
jgi:hypothetical protein